MFVSVGALIVERLKRKKRIKTERIKTESAEKKSAEPIQRRSKSALPLSVGSARGVSVTLSALRLSSRAPWAPQREGARLGLGRG